jgi:glycosyltransferase involved in cell wall biosynthesis
MAPYKLLSDLALILDPACASVLMITGNTDRIIRPSATVKVADIGISMHFLGDKNPEFYSALVWIIKSIFLVQLRTSIELVKARNDVDLVLFYMAYPWCLLSLVTAKMLGKRAIDVVTHGKPVTLFAKLYSVQDPIFFRLLDGVAPESRGLIKVLGLRRYHTPILPEGARFVDTSRYSPKKQLSERSSVVGFVGRLIDGKGIVDFVRAIPAIAHENKDVSFLIGGGGELLQWVTDACEQIKAQGIDVRVTGWIGDDLPERLNELKLLVLPTRYDALPTILLEAMACGTPVIATPVGGIPDIIKEGESGLLLANGQAECIAETVTKALTLSTGELARIVENAKATVDARFSYAAAVKRFEDILSLKRSTNFC